jgi:hypothetical protein
MHVGAGGLRNALRTIPLSIGILLAGCGGQASLPAPSFLDKLMPASIPPQPPPVAEKKSDCGTAAQCRSALKTMVDGKDRAWIGQKLPPDAYADGTRLFAYRALRKRLNCQELGLAVDEVRAASKSLKGPMPTMTPEQADRTRTLNTQVEGELTKEQASRCRAKA